MQTDSLCFRLILSVLSCTELRADVLLFCVSRVERDTERYFVFSDFSFQFCPDFLGFFRRVRQTFLDYSDCAYCLVDLVDCSRISEVS